ncbi:uncharacterized protein FA14DRAFT_153820 [Meira miltonrushii]|uniref:Uncharacterized protein n=1 Tax=Meira miltonrushii TaxID=1280837 RepID=A0A316VN58_9BASI|nr:uncharacterized protein FA14DRAFT_153820 [Meira miltonrushii]PWN38498.1 hypothetical protein FA14DRAFT_153820 [Meira miltonrushii]
MVLYVLSFIVLICAAFMLSASAEHYLGNERTTSPGITFVLPSSQPKDTELIMFKRSSIPLVMHDKAPPKKSANLEVESSSSNPDNNNNNNNNEGSSKGTKKKGKNKQIARAAYDQRTHRVTNDIVTYRRKPKQVKPGFQDFEYHDFGALGSMLVLDGGSDHPQPSASKPTKKGKKKQNSSSSSTSAPK